MGAAIFDHMEAAILCVGVMVNLHITLLLDRIEAWSLGWGQLVCPEGCSESGWGFPWVGSDLGKGLVMVCRPATPSGDPSGGPGILDLFIFYN